VRHNLYFRTVDDAKMALAVIRQKFTSNVISEGSVLSFVTPYTIRQGAQTSITQSVKSHRGEFNIKEGQSNDHSGNSKQSGNSSS